MNEARLNTIVGLFAVVGIAVLAILVFIYGGGRGLFHDTYDVRVHFEDGVVGVQEGQGVTLFGKRIGETKGIEFIQDPNTGQALPEAGVHVIVAIDGRYSIPTSAEVTVATSIMGLGRPLIRLEWVDPQETSFLPRDGRGVIKGRMIPIIDQLIPPEMQGTVTGATDQIRILADALTPAARNLGRLLDERDIDRVDMQELTANLDTVIQRFDLTLKNLNVIIGNSENQENLRIALANTRKMSESGVALVDNLTLMSEDGKQVMKEVGSLTRQLMATANDVSAVLKRMDQALAMLTEGQGSAALFLRDNRLYEELVLSIRRLQGALDAVQEAFRDGRLHWKMQ